MIAAIFSAAIAPIVLSFGDARAQIANDVQPPPKFGRGGVPPANLDAIVAAQKDANAVSTVLLQSFLASKKANLPKAAAQPACSPGQDKFDWSALKKVTAVQNQGTCGDCWAFAAVAAYEASYLIESGLVASASRPPAASEQEALDCAYTSYDCGGGWPDKVLAYFTRPEPGETARNKYAPYTAIKHNCAPVATREYKALNWDFVAGATIPDDNLIKAAICEHGPVVAGVSAKGWDDYIPSPPNYKYKYSKAQNPNFLKDFPNGVYVYPNDFPSDKRLTMATYTPRAVDHIVLIVGWDDSFHAWIIKNSWGSEWGDNGFIKLKYGTGNIGFNAAWVLAQGQGPSPAPAVSRALDIVNRDALMKSMAAPQ
jgi:cathepsin L